VTAPGPAPGPAPGRAPVSAPGRAPVPASLTHQHLAAAIATEHERHGWTGPTAVLDAGCGAGDLVGFLHRALPASAPEADWQVHGFDVVDSTSTRTNRPAFPATTIAALDAVDGATPWSERIAAVGLADPWPYEDGTFPVVVSNQVLEHVVDAAHLLRELARVLAPGGVSLHVFPLREALLEGHLLTPLASRFQGHEQRVRWLELAYRAGLGKPAHRAGGAAAAAEDADYLHHATHYRSWGQLAALAKRVGLRASYRYTGELYGQKLRALLGRPPRHRYRVDRGAVRDWAALVTLRYAASITLVLERPPASSPYHLDAGPRR
jgi:SAM-dependent methyltransferase